MGSEGWIKVHRKIMESAVFEDALLFRTWMFILLSATREPREKLVKGKIVKLNAGDYVTSARVLADKLKIDPKTANKQLNMLEKLGCIERKKEAACSIITIKKWSDYQENTECVPSSVGMNGTHLGTHLGTTTRSKELKKKETTVVPLNGTHLGTDNLLRHYAGCGFPLNGYAAQNVAELQEEYGETWCREAMTRASEAGKPTISYLKGILNNWKTQGGMKLKSRSEQEQQERIEKEKAQRAAALKRQQQEQAEADAKQSILDEIPELYQIRADMADLIKQMIKSSSEQKKSLEIKRQELVARKKELLVARGYKGDEI